MEFLMNLSSFVFFILYLGTKNSHAVMKFSDDTKLGDIINGKKACGIENLGFLVFYLQLPVAALQYTAVRVLVKNLASKLDKAI